MFIVRFKKMKEVEQLETENMELKKILKQFMDSEQVFNVMFYKLILLIFRSSNKYTCKIINTIIFQNLIRSQQIIKCFLTNDITQ